METLTLILLIIAIIIVVGGLFFGGLFLGIFAKAQPVMSFMVVDYSGLETSGKIELRHIKYHPTSMSYANPLPDTPEHAGLVTVVEKHGWFGWFTRPLHWDANSIIPPRDLKHGLGTYKLELTNRTLKQRLDKLDDENTQLTMLNDELRQAMLIAQRSTNEHIDAGVAKRIKDSQSLMPVLGNPSKGRSSGRGGG